MTQCEIDDDIEAIKIIDEHDPIRLSFHMMKGRIPEGAEILLNDGTSLFIIEVADVGCAAVRLRIAWMEPCHDGKESPCRVDGAATIPYQAIALIRQRDQPQESRTPPSHSTACPASAREDGGNPTGMQDCTPSP